MKPTLSALHAHPYGRIAILLILFLLPATLIRAGLYLGYHEDFNNMGTYQTTGQAQMNNRILPPKP
jgi:hypothetical protein